MNEGLYDNCPAVGQWDDGVTNISRPFKYFNMWIQHKIFKTKLREAGK